MRPQGLLGAGMAPGGHEASDAEPQAVMAPVALKSPAQPARVQIPRPAHPKVSPGLQGAASGQVASSARPGQPGTVAGATVAAGAVAGAAAPASPGALAGPAT
mmetsp:Transcript_98175/g.316656  ORF Transcript_98175/g.316656 Transcript_98175/m.316656 type:complete len:103 (+) Transcript_98175:1139-1447(+)